MNAPLSVGEVNALSEGEFVARFGDIAEGSPWVAVAAAAFRPYRDRAEMVAAFESAMRAAAPEAILALICAHPDRAGLAPLDNAYRDRFGFPFIFARKEAGKEMILAALAARLGNDAETEFETAMLEIARIFRFRIEDRVAP